MIRKVEDMHEEGSGMNDSRTESLSSFLSGGGAR